MAGFFDATRAALAAGRTVGLAVLAAFEFAEGTSRFWLTGAGRIEAGGHIWTGAGYLVAVSAVSAGGGDGAATVTFTLSGVNAALLTLARTAQSVRGRTVTLYGQFLDTATLQPTSDIWVLPAPDVMDRISFSASGPSERSVAITAETIWAARELAQNAYYSDRNQQARSPGDRGMEAVYTMRNKFTTWPRYTEA